MPLLKGRNSWSTTSTRQFQIKLPSGSTCRSGITLSTRDQRVVDELAAGERTSDVARKFGVSAGRISQMRGQLKKSWKSFVGDQDGDNEE